MGRPKLRRSFRGYILSDVGAQARRADSTTENRKSPLENTWTTLPHEITPKLTLLDGNLRPIPKVSLSERIMARLMKLEAREVNPHFADDYRLAWLTVFYASDKSRTWTDGFGPWEFSFCSMFGKHPKKAIKFWLERAEKNAEMRRGPRKPMQSVPLPEIKKEIK